MTPFDQEIIKERTQGATTEEKVWMASCLPTDILENELARRNSKAITVLNDLIEAICTASKDMSLQDMESLIKSIKDIAKGKKKAVKEEIEEVREEEKEEYEENTLAENLREVEREIEDGKDERDDGETVISE